MSSTAAVPFRRATVITVIVAGCLISLTGFGIRSTFGLYLEPMTVAKGWSRETFALAMALQNLLWGGRRAGRGGDRGSIRAHAGDRLRRRRLRHGSRGDGGVGQRARAPSERRAPHRLRDRAHFVLTRARRHRAGRRAGAPFVRAGHRHRGRLARPGGLLSVLPEPDLELWLARLARAGLLHHAGHDPARVHPAGLGQGRRRAALGPDPGPGARSARR